MNLSCSVLRRPNRLHREATFSRSSTSLFARQRCATNLRKSTGGRLSATNVVCQLRSLDLTATVRHMNELGRHHKILRPQSVTFLFMSSFSNQLSPGDFTMTRGPSISGGLMGVCIRRYRTFVSQHVLLVWAQRSR